MALPPVPRPRPLLRGGRHADRELERGLARAGAARESVVRADGELVAPRGERERRDTRHVELMVDGDGGAQIDLRIDGEARPLDAAEVAFLLAGEGEGTPALRRQCIEARPDGDGLRIDLV